MQTPSNSLTLTAETESSTSFLHSNLILYSKSFKIVIPTHSTFRILFFFKDSKKQEVKIKMFTQPSYLQ